ncbi:hypothetical protein JXQ70_18155 [bacterium]|nr:hypothetical protein [bacterium]
MSLVNFLRFSDTMGAIISDEEFWTPRFRRRLHTDNLHSLLDDEMSEAWKMEVAYGGVGYPSVHREVVNQVRALLKQRLHENNEATPAPTQVKHVARLAFECMQQVIRRRIDQKLRFKFGFTTDDLNRGYYEENGKKVEIKNKEIKQAAQKIAAAKEKDALLKPAMEAKAAIFGYDSTYGMTGFFLDSEAGVLAYNYEGFEAIGTGKYASGMIFGLMFGAKTLAMRQAGFDPAEGVLELINSALAAKYHFKEVGGNLNFVIIKADEKKHALRYREIFDNDARLSAEIVQAYKWEELTRAAAINLLNQLLFSRKKWETVEKELFASVKNGIRFELLLRHYKKDEVDQLMAQAR